jgi:hypothetical protein
MKQKDLPIIIVVVFLSAIVSFIVSSKIFTPPQSRQQAVEVVPVINKDFPAADNKYFNAQSIDPTQIIQIGNSNNQNPF